MADYTPNYGLHQWEAGDSFLRTDFNQDFSKIDAALGRAERSAQANAYNLYNLMLQNYYESKYTGYKKALIFDGFMDGSGIGAKSDAIGLVASPPGLRLYAAGAGERIQNYGTSTWVSPGSVSDSWVSPGRGRATGVKLCLSGSGSSQIRVTLSGGGKSVSADHLFSYASATEVTLTFSAPLVLEGGVGYTLEVRNTGSYAVSVYTSSSGALGYHLLCTPLDAPTGTVTARAVDSGVTGTRALAWVRYAGGSAGMSLNGTEMTRTGMRNAQTLQGTACVEQSFVLEGTFSGTLTPALFLDALGSGGMTVYDYGVILL